MMASLLLQFLDLEDDQNSIVDGFARPVLRNWNGMEIGSIRPTAPLLES
jgi:hypothetical protein